MSNNSKYNFYTRGRTEPSMRDEMIHTLEGFFPEIAKKIPVLLRKMRRDQYDHLIRCECVDPVTKEPDKDNFCPLCHGEGHKWDEKLMDVYKVVIRSDVGNSTKEQWFDPGIVNLGDALFYTEYNQPVTEDDKIVELTLDLEGKVTRPPSRHKLYRIVSALPLRGDTGRVEFLKLGCFEEKRKFLNG